MIRSDSPPAYASALSKKFTPPVVRGLEAVARLADVELRAERDPRAERQHAHLQPGPTQTSIFHGSDPMSAGARSGPRADSGELLRVVDGHPARRAQHVDRGIGRFFAGRIEIHVADLGTEIAVCERAAIVVGDGSGLDHLTRHGHVLVRSGLGLRGRG